MVLVHRPLVEVFNSKTGVSCTEGGILVAMIEILNSITTIPITAAADVFSPWLVQLVPVNQREGEELDVSLDGLVSEFAGNIAGNDLNSAVIVLSMAGIDSLDVVKCSHQKFRVILGLIICTGKVTVRLKTGCTGCFCFNPPKKSLVPTGK